jgi:twitching motility protein PilT
MPLEKQDLIETLNEWLKTLIQKNGTNLHIKTNAPIKAKINGSVVLLSKNLIGSSSATINGIIRVLLSNKATQLQTEKEYDGIYIIDDKYRFRYNIYRHHNGYALNFRRIPHEIKSIEGLNLPSALYTLTKLKHGLVLITGATGSGKSTTLATLIQEINKTSQQHIITIENPIEYIYEDQQCIIEQREVGIDTNSFQNAMHSAMRQDANIIVVGEIRDLATAESIMQAVNTGHLVFSTTHTLDATETVDRMISIFPSSEQNRVRATLAATLEAVISQRLVKSKSEEMLPAVEMMFKSPLIQEYIRNSRDHEILDAMEKEAHSFHSVTFDKALFNLTLAGKIDEETAYKHATSPADLKLMLSLSEAYHERSNY